MTKLCNDFLGQAVKINIFIFATYSFAKTHLVCPPKFCILSIDFDYSWEDCNSQEKRKTRCIIRDVQMANC